MGQDGSVRLASLEPLQALDTCVIEKFDALHLVRLQLTHKSVTNLNLQKNKVNSHWEILAVAKVDHQTTEFNSPPAILYYFIYRARIYLDYHTTMKL